MVWVDIILNAAVAVLLAVTIAYCWHLNRRIRALQDGRGELAKLLKHFDDSTRRASESIAMLQTANRKLGENVQARIDKANLVADDLMFLIERAVKLTDELEAGLAARRAAEAAMLSQRTQAAPVVKAEPKKAPPQQEPDKVKDSRALLEALAKRSASDPALRGSRNAGMGQPRPRTRIEQELLDLVKAEHN